jgi:hypothetical protein
MINNYSYDQAKSAVFDSAKKKLNKYLNEGGQPSIPFFKSCRIFDPHQFLTMDQTLSEYTSAIPELSRAQEEWALYCKIANEFAQKATYENSNILTFWQTNKPRLPIMFEVAEWVLAFFTNTADVERSI